MLAGGPVMEKGGIKMLSVQTLISSQCFGTLTLLIFELMVGDILYIEGCFVILLTFSPIVTTKNVFKHYVS